MAKNRQDAKSVSIRDISRSGSLSFELRPDDAERAEISRTLGFEKIRKLSFSGTLGVTGNDDVVLEAKLGATVTQKCVATLDPVTTRIDTSVIRRFVDDMVEPSPGTETEMPEDDTIDPLPGLVDLQEIMIETLALEAPDYPRRDDAEPITVTATPPGAAPITDADTKPFAALEELKHKLNRNG